MNCRSIHSYAWLPRWSSEGGERAAARAAAHGYCHLVIPLRDPETIDPARIARFCAAEGVVPLTTSPLGPDTDISSTDAEVAARGLARHRVALALARDMGAPRMGGILYGAFGKAAQAPVAGQFEASAEGLARLADEAAASGMLLTLEVVNRYESNLVNTAAEGVRLVEAIGRPNVGLHLDTFHMNIEEDDMLAALGTALPHLAYFEIDQNHRGRLSAGTIRFEPLLAWLKDAGYAGLVGVEAFSSAVSHPDVAAGVASWRPLFADGCEVAEEGRALFDRCGF
ncbi:sugar phosphate isomerase/epimerase family protein [Cereibacter johrii]|uniref:sugar phosphate isomerase/epimerase family protein n=1 Tax=Cereibacter johrii TaxID=445629 RepID=UPI003CEE27A6